MKKEEFIEKYPRVEIVDEPGDVDEPFRVLIVPRGRRNYTTFPVRDKDTQEELPGAIHITGTEYEGVVKGALMFNDDLTGVIPFAFTEEEQAQRAAAEEETARQARAAEIRARMAELDYDINACADGVVKAKTEAEYRAERVALRNELRELEGKTALPMAEEESV